MGNEKSFSDGNDKLSGKEKREYKLTSKVMPSSSVMEVVVVDVINNNKNKKSNNRETKF